MNGAAMTTNINCLGQTQHDESAFLAVSKDALFAAAGGLVNPASGVANDYLNNFTEILLLIENLPILLPEMVEELITWRPKSYEDYFRGSPLKGSQAAIAIYRGLDSTFRRCFEACIDHINTLALQSIGVISALRSPDGELRSEDVEQFCLKTSEEIRAALAITVCLVNHGLGNQLETPQHVADRILAQVAHAANA